MRRLRSALTKMCQSSNTQRQKISFTSQCEDLRNRNCMSEEVEAVLNHGMFLISVRFSDLRDLGCLFKSKINIFRYNTMYFERHTGESVISKGGVISMRETFENSSKSKGGDWKRPNVSYLCECHINVV